MRADSIQVLVDNDSWILPYAARLVSALQTAGFDAVLVRHFDDIQPGWITFMLGCIRLVPDHVLDRSTHNLVVHESALPEGRGFAPMTWQILQGHNNIPICLIEAAVDADSGDIWLQDTIALQGHELCDEWRTLQGEKTLELCLRFVSDYTAIRSRKQNGHPTYYPRRYPKDSKLDPDTTIRDLFPILRVADNQRYPAFFELNGHRYFVHIFKAD